MSNTAFGRWLDRRGESAWSFAKRMGMNKAAIYALAGIRSHRSPMFFKTGTLERIAAETGISVNRLYTDWTQAEPRDPRPYTRRAPDAAAE